MEVVREIELEAAPEDVWEALTDETQLEEWFANDVELDPTPGGRGVFRWDNGETREASSSPSRRASGSSCASTTTASSTSGSWRPTAAASSRCGSRRPRGRPRIEFRALAACAIR